MVSDVSDILGGQVRDCRKRDETSTDITKGWKNISVFKRLLTIEIEIFGNKGQTKRTSLGNASQG